MKNRIIAIVFTCCFSQQLRSQDSLDITYGEKIIEHYAIVYKDSSLAIQGKVTAYYAFDTSKVAIEKYFMNGKQNGTYRAYFPEGGLMHFGVYGNGERNGEWTWYDRSGDILIKGKYKNGQKHGFWAYRRNKCYGHYRKGIMQGKWVCYEEGKKVKYYYKNGYKLPEK